MKRIVGILIIVLVLYGLILASDPNARTLANFKNIAQRVSLYGIITIGAGILIISGGIDLSIGSVVGLGAVALGLLLGNHVAPWLAILVVLGGGALIGVGYGLLVTRLRLQPIISTLCGLFIYRGLAFWLALPNPAAPLRGLVRFLSLGHLYAQGTQTGSAGNVGIGAVSKELPGLIHFASDFTPRLLLLGVVAVLAALLLHSSVYGRYLYAIGSNEQAARYAGINTNRYKVLAYLLCSMLAALVGILQMLETQTASPSTEGQWYELYAITGAVLGGCSLRGGEGTVIGMLLGTAVLPLLRNLINFSNIPGDLEFTVIGVALLLGTIADELLKRRAAKKV
jgi:ribose transport system permease protein